MYPIWLIYDNLNKSKDYTQIIIIEIFYDYRNTEIGYIDFKIWNYYRFKLILTILGYTRKKEYLISLLIKMMTIKISEKIHMKYNDFSNQEYKNYKEINEFKEFKKTIKKFKTNWILVETKLEVYKFQDLEEEKNFNQLSKEIIKWLKKS